ncbi:lysosomal membrane ascorbate-dependent ferrireductase CYB561A3-like isoform X2 [Rhynchophorus ferrugineus]
MEAQSEHQRTKMYNTLYSFTTSLGTGLLLLVLFWILHCRGGFTWQSNPKTQFNWHPFLMLLGMVFLYSQAMLVYRTGRMLQKKKLKIIHAALHLLAFIMSVIGLKAVFDSHNLSKEPIANLYTIHSWLGLLTVIIFSMQFLSGFISFLYPGLSPTLRKTLMPIHVIIGTSAFVMGLISSLTGLTEKVIWTLNGSYSSFPPEAFLFNAIGLIITLYGLLVLYLVNEPLYKRATIPEDELALTGSE